VPVPALHGNGLIFSPEQANSRPPAQLVCVNPGWHSEKDFPAACGVPQARICRSALVFPVAKIRPFPGRRILGRRGRRRTRAITRILKLSRPLRCAPQIGGKDCDWRAWYRRDRAGGAGNRFRWNRAAPMASSGESTGVLPFYLVCLGPPLPCAQVDGGTWPHTSRRKTY
jgi:hypothetical protein